MTNARVTEQVGGSTELSAASGAPGPGLCVEALLERIEQLEARLGEVESGRSGSRRSARSWRAAVPFTLVIGAMVLSGAEPAAPKKLKVLQVERLEIVDPNGALVLAAGVDERGVGGVLDVWDGAGRQVLRAGANELGGDLNLWHGGVEDEGAVVFRARATASGADVGLWNLDGKRVVSCASAETGGAIALQSSAGLATFEAAADEHGFGRLALGAAEGATSFTAGSDERGAGVVRVRNAAAVNAIELGSDDHGAGRALVRNAAGQTILSVESDEAIGCSLSLADKAGKRRVHLAADPAGGAASFLNDGGLAVVTAGVGPQGGGFLDLFGPGGSRVVAAAAESDGGGRLDVADETGRFVFTVDAISGAGAALALFNSEGRKGLVALSREDGGLINLFNRNEVPVVVGGYAPEGLGGALSVRNERGLAVVHASTDDEGTGTLAVYTPDGTSSRTIKPK